MDQPYSLKKLTWACRRGMLELDVLLQKFLQKCFFTLNEQEKANFLTLIEHSDQTLFNWFFGQEKSPKELHDLIRLIKNNASSRPANKTL